MEILIILSAAILFLFLFYKFWFLRNPEIKVVCDNNIVSPANGKIIKIIEYGIEDNNVEIFKKNNKFFVFTKDVSAKGYIIVIMMNIFNIHYQKAPLNGEIISTNHIKGKFLNAVFGADNLEATLVNEKNETLIDTARGKIKIIQIAGVIARRICSFVKKGQQINKGEDIGLIKLGSQVVLVIPKSDLKIKENDIVEAGITPIA